MSQADDRHHATSALATFEMTLMGLLDAVREELRADPRIIAIAKTQLELGFMAAHKAINTCPLPPRPRPTSS